jgi:hypothetical protein
MITGGEALKLNDDSYNFPWSAVIQLIIFLSLSIWAVVLSLNLNNPIAKKRGNFWTDVLVVIYAINAFFFGPVYLMYYLLAYVAWNASLN